MSFSNTRSILNFQTIGLRHYTEMLLKYSKIEKVFIVKVLYIILKGKPSTLIWKKKINHQLLLEKKLWKFEVTLINNIFISTKYHQLQSTGRVIQSVFGQTSLLISVISTRYTVMEDKCSNVSVTEIWHIAHLHDHYFCVPSFFLYSYVQAKILGQLCFC